MFKKYKYCIITNNINQKFLNSKSNTGIYQWLKVFNGELKHIRGILPELKNSAYDIIHIIISNEDFNLPGIIRNIIGKKSKTKITASCDLTLEEIMRMFNNKNDLKLELLKTDLIFSSLYNTSRFLEQLTVRNVHLIPNPADIKGIKNLISNNEKSNYAYILGAGEVNETFIKIMGKYGFEIKFMQSHELEEINYSELPGAGFIYTNHIDNNIENFIVTLAVLGKLFAGNVKIDSIKQCYSYTAFDVDNPDILDELADKIINDIEFRGLVARNAIAKAEFYNFSTSFNRLLEALYYETFDDDFRTSEKIEIIKENYNDSDLTFYMQVYHDYEIADWSLSKVRKFYPSSRIIVISDGDKDERYLNFISKYNIEYIEGDRLFPVSNGGLMIKRMFDAFLRKPSRYFFSMDSDTEFHRRFMFLPDENFFGSWCIEKLNCLQGGFIGYSLEAVSKIIDSKILESKELLDYKKTWAINKHMIDMAENKLYTGKFSGLIADEFITAYCFKKIGIKASSFNEVCCEWKIPIENKNLKYAVTHPCRFKYK